MDSERAPKEPNPPARPLIGSHLAPGLALVALVTILAQFVNIQIPQLSALVVAVMLGAMLANLGLIWEGMQPGLSFAGRYLLRAGIVLLGLRLSLSQLGELGAPALLVVSVTVAITLFGVLALGQAMGLTRDLSLLVATGYAICGASAIAAVEGATEAEEEEVAMAIGLVTLFGSLAIFILPVVGDLLGLSVIQFGTWAGASVHDVAQVVATAEPAGEDALAAAVVVKLTRVILLAPIVAGANILARRRRTGKAEMIQGRAKAPIVPVFVVMFLAMILVRSSGILGEEAISLGRNAEGLLLTAALVGLGSGVRVDRLRRLGFQPIILGFVAWVLVASVAYTGVILTT